ncbi:MAG TPA: ferritin-like domain-containing protein [Gemmatimonadaceae bacterium]|jgi:rubrerythrin
MLQRSKTLVIERPEQLMKVSTRRDFLKVLGVGGAIVFLPAVFAACDDDSSTNPITGSSLSLNLSTDTGILNYAYALEQLEAAFYTAVVAGAAFSGYTAEQQEVLADIRNHEVIHREFFKAALGSNAIPTLNLSSTVVASTMTNIATILKNAEMFEDLGVSAYNGAGKYLASADYLTVAGKIVSVEARHAATIRDMREALTSGAPTAVDGAGTRFADSTVINAQGLDVKLEPSAVLGRVASTGIVTDSISIGTPPSKAATTDAGPPSPTP